MDPSHSSHQATSSPEPIPSRLPHDILPSVRRGLKRPALQHTSARSVRVRKWAKHCGCSGPCQAELFDEDNDECEDLDLEALENLLKRRRSNGQESTSRELRGSHSARSDGSRTSGNGSAASESDCESQPTSSSSSSPPQLLHFLLMF